MQITVTQLIDIKFEIVGTCYGATQKGDVYNLKTGRKLKRCLVGLTKGYCINGKFTSLAKLRQKLKKIEKIELPF